MGYQELNKKAEQEYMQKLSETPAYVLLNKLYGMYIKALKGLNGDDSIENEDICQEHRDTLKTVKGFLETGHMSITK